MDAAEKGLQGKTAVVTGAGRGIGKAIAIGYAKAGAEVVCAARSVEEIEGTAEEIIAMGGKAIAVRTDVTSMESVSSLFESAHKYCGGLDILVVNAGVNFDRNTVENSSMEDWKQTIEVNLFGAYYCVRAAIPYFKQRGAGKIITIGSGLGHQGYAGGSAYSCSKAGLWMLTRILAQELMEYGISVNELIPGPVQTTIDLHTRDGLTKEAPVKSSGSRSAVMDKEWSKQPEDVVPLALFLASQPDIGPTAQSFSLMRRDRN
jgi:3-oxoacyl-[acyl-carrier protein] reductase